jgi:hypothetical protein
MLVLRTRNNLMTWKIYQRRGTALRRRSRVSSEWKLVKTYSTLKAANQAYELLLKRYDIGGGMKAYQIKLVEI